MLTLEAEAHLMMDLADHEKSCTGDGSGIVRGQFQRELGGFPGFRYEECDCGETVTAGCAECDAFLMMISHAESGWCLHARMVIDAGLMPDGEGDDDRCRY